MQGKCLDLLRLIARASLGRILLGAEGLEKMKWPEGDLQEGDLQETWR